MYREQENIWTVTRGECACVQEAEDQHLVMYREQENIWTVTRGKCACVQEAE